MATAGRHADSKGMYSWWWNSHISPKNSKWLKENLTDMDTKVKQMIKLIEEDADSFARRAEMYYKKRPELMKLVEEFYRAYRALAERYDHATVVLCQAHRTMAEAFPNQVPLVFPDDSPAGSASEVDPHTPEMPPPVRVSFDPHELQRDAGLNNGVFTEEPDSVTIRKGLKQLNDLFGSGDAKNHVKYGEGKARKGLNFLDVDENEQNSLNHGSTDLKVRVPSESERVGKAEMEILNLKKALARLEDEKEAGLLQYQQSLERLSNLEAEVARAQGDSRGLNERASKAESEVQTLKDALTKLEAEREASLVQYQQCLEKMSNLETNIYCVQKDAGELNERASNAETEAEALKQYLAGVEAEKEASQLQYKQSLETISNLEEKLLHAEENARRITEQAEKAESEVETLKQAISKLTEEKEAAAVQYNQCLEKIYILEQKIACAEEEALRLNREVDDGVAKLKVSEERCLLLDRSNQSLQAELDSLVQKMGAQSEELTEKQKELGRLWTSMQEERLRFMEAETAFQTLQHLHSQSQEELRSLALEFRNRTQNLKDIEACKQDLEDELLKVKDENKNLKELNLSSSVTIENLQGEILSLRQTIQKLEAEVELRVDQRNALQQEIYCLKEEINDLNKRLQAMMGEVESVGLNPECFGSSVKVLQEENTMLKEVSKGLRVEKLVLLEKLDIMEKLVEKNAVLENSLSDLNVELEGVKGKAKALEGSCHSLLGEKSALAAEKDTLICQIQIATENLEKLSERNNFLENSLFDANAELEELRIKFKSVEDSCLLLGDEKSSLIMEREGLVSKLNVSETRLKDSEKRYVELEEKCMSLEKERESMCREVEELQNSLASAQQQQTIFAQSSEIRLTAMELQIHSLHEESQFKKKQYEEELDKAMTAEMEIFILQQFIKDQEDKNFSLFSECRKHLQACQLSGKRISELEHENCEKQVEMKTALDQIRMLRMSNFQVLKTLEIDTFYDCEDKIEQDQMYLSVILGRLKEMQNSLLKAVEENQKYVIENSVLIVLLGQLKLDADNLAEEKNALNQELWIQSEQFTSLQHRAQKLVEMNDELSSQVMSGGHREVVLGTEIEKLHGQLSELQMLYQNLLEENCKVLDERRSLTKEVFDLCEEKHNLEEQNSVLLSEVVSQSNSSLIFKNIMIDNFEEVKQLSYDLGKLNCVNNGLEENLRKMERKLEDMQMENSHLKDTLRNLENELILVRSVSEQLNLQVANGKDLLFQKENALLEAEQMLSGAQDERTELQKIVEDLKRKYEEVSMTRENQEKQIMKLCGDYDHQVKETENLQEANQKLDVELLKLHQELEKTKYVEEILSDELRKGKNEIEFWETKASALFGELQISVVQEAMLEGKLHELNEAHEDLENRSTLKVMEVDELKERISTLEGENGGLKAHVAAYVPAVNSLKNCITSLENCILMRAKHLAGDKEEVKDANMSDGLHAESCQKTNEDQLTVPDSFSDMQYMEFRIKSIEKVLMEMEKFAMLERRNANSRLEAAMRQIEELRSGNHSGRESIRAKKHMNAKREDGHFLSKMQKPTPEISEESNDVMTKDIMLDQVSDCSSYGLSRRDTLEIDDEMLELWETANRNGSIDLKVGKARKGVTMPTDHHNIEPVKQRKGKNLSTESLVKELGVDKLEVPKRYAEPDQEGSRRKILERLDSDAQKLTNLQITVQDLKRTVEITEKAKKGKGLELDTVKGQLEEAEEDIMKLFDINRKLVSHVEDGSLSLDGKSTIESDGNRSLRRRTISEQARRVSEKIGRLQLEVQKLQFLLLKLDDEKESRGRTRITDRKTRVLLRDYLYGGRRTIQKKKKTPFCSCVQPPTRGD
ncbi:hypothetical protein SLE2022_245330 [Rubroshorea leprosula]